MNDTPIFEKPPITEALIDIRVTLPGETTIASLDSIYEAIRDLYPTKQALTNWEAGFGFGPGGTGAVAQTVSRPGGFIYRSSNGRRAVQVKTDGFTFNWLKPYERWEPFRDEARRLWELYRSAAKPRNVVRTALRYINRIEIPLPMGDFSEYITTVPQIAPVLPQGLSQFLMRLEIPYPDHSTTAVITETIAPLHPDAAIVPIIFDIDVFKETERSPDSEEIWSDLESVRKVKNEIFLGSITDKTRELFR